MNLEIVSPEAKLFSGEVTAVTFPGIDGSFQVLNHHAPIVAALGPGSIKITGNSFAHKEISNSFIKLNEQNYSLPISSGTVEMKNNKIIVLVD